MRILYYEVGRTNVEINIPNELKTLQDLVGGHLETVKVNADLSVVCNEEGLILNLPYNRVVNGQIIFGNFFITKFDGIDDFTDLTDEDINMILNVYSIN